MNRFAATVILTLVACTDVPDVYEETAVEQASTAPTIPAPGTYQLVREGGAECVDVPGFAKGAAALQGYPCKHTGYLGNQQITVESVTGGYRLRAFDSQLCFDLPNSATADGTIVQQSSCHTGQNQIWTFAVEPGNHVAISPRLAAGKCLYVDSAHAVRIAGCGSVAASSRRFGFARTRTHVSLRSGDTGQCLDMASFTTASGATPQLYTCKTDPTNVTNQEWTLDPVAGAFRIIQRNASKCLDVRGGSPGDGAILEQDPCNGSTTQQWRLLAFANERWKLQNVSTGRCADFYAGALRQYACSTAFTSQLWQVEPGLSGPAISGLVKVPSPTPLVAGNGLWAEDPTLGHPTISGTRATDNAIIITWTDPNGAATQGYQVWIAEDGFSARNEHDTYYVFPGNVHATAIIARSPTQALLAGHTYGVEVFAVGQRGMSPSHSSAKALVTLSIPSIRIGVPTANGPAQAFPTPVQGIAPLDVNRDGQVDGAVVGAGPFPAFPSGAGQATPGSRYDTAGTTHGNLVVGYDLAEGATSEFLAAHLAVDDANGVTPLAIVFGDFNGRAWMGIPNAGDVTLNVEDGDPQAGLPSIVTGRATATLVSPGAGPFDLNRVVELTFSLVPSAH